MKLHLIIFFLAGSFCYSQDFSEKFAGDICECFSKQQNEKTPVFDPSVMDTCFNIPNEKYRTDLELLFLLENIDTSTVVNPYQEGQELGKLMGKKVFDNIQSQLINSCDSYFDYFVKSQKTMLINLGKGVTKHKVDSITNLIEKSHWPTNLIWERGSFQLGLGNTQAAKSDFETCLKRSPIHVPALFFLAWAHDIEGNYALAIPLYERMIEQSTHSMVFMAKIYLAVDLRKVKEGG